MQPVQSNFGKEISVVNNGHANDDEALAKGGKLRRGKNGSSGIISADKVLIFSGEFVSLPCNGDSNAIVSFTPCAGMRKFH